MKLFAILQEAGDCKTLQYFSYQTVSRIVTETGTGNRVRNESIQSVAYVV